MIAVMRWPFAAMLVLTCGLLPAMAAEEPAVLPKLAPVSDVPCDEQPYSVLLTIANVKEARGSIAIELYDEVPEHFLRGYFKVGIVRVPAVKGEVTACVPIPKAGGYGLAVYHDRNDNTKFDKTWLGLPSEPYGTSNNPRFELRAPRIDEALFQVTGPLTPMKVNLRG
jgi:uncharacterized protein (DUF2141 family)